MRLAQDWIMIQFTRISKRVSRTLATRWPILASNRLLRALSPSEGGMSSGQISVHTHVKVTSANVCMAWWVNTCSVIWPWFGSTIIGEVILRHSAFLLRSSTTADETFFLLPTITKVKDWNRRLRSVLTTDSPAAEPYWKAGDWWRCLGQSSLFHKRPDSLCSWLAGRLL